MADKIRCEECEYCEDRRGIRQTRASFFCEHPDKAYISEYYKKHGIRKMEGFIEFGKSNSDKFPIKTSPKWCPKKKEGKVCRK